MPATNDVKRGTLGCDVDAVSSGSEHRGESPYATPPPVVPEGLQVPGQVSAKSSSGHAQVRCSRAKGEAQGRCASRLRRSETDGEGEEEEEEADEAPPASRRLRLA